MKETERTNSKQEINFYFSVDYDEFKPETYRGIFIEWLRCWNS
jgi:hypothetical protein